MEIEVRKERRAEKMHLISRVTRSVHLNEYNFDLVLEIASLDAIASIAQCEQRFLQHTPKRYARFKCSRLKRTRHRHGCVPGRTATLDIYDDVNSFANHPGQHTTTVHDLLAPAMCLAMRIGRALKS